MFAYTMVRGLLVGGHVNGHMLQLLIVMSQIIGYLEENVRMILIIVEHDPLVHQVVLELVSSLVQIRHQTVVVAYHGLEQWSRVPMLEKTGVGLLCQQHITVLQEAHEADVIVIVLSHTAALLEVVYQEQPVIQRMRLIGVVWMHHGLEMGQHVTKHHTSHIVVHLEVLSLEQHVQSHNLPRPIIHAQAEEPSQEAHVH